MFCASQKYFKYKKKNYLFKLISILRKLEPTIQEIVDFELGFGDILLTSDSYVVNHQA